MSSRRMGGMKLGDFGKTTPSKPTEPSSEPEQPPAAQAKPASPPKSKAAPEEEKLTTVNIKIKRSQQEWLADTARQVRDNNTAPVPPSDRVYPQHLIGVAIDLLQSMDVDWQEIRNVEELKQQLKLSLINLTL